MPNYRRRFMPGGCWFFTVNLQDRRLSLLTENIDALRAAMRSTMRKHPFQIDAFVVLPDHLHAIWTLPPDDTDFSMRWRLIKTQFARALPKNESRDDVRVARRERGIWQRRCWEHLIRDEKDFAVYVEYCAINPVKHGLAQRPIDWPYSSFHRDLKRGMFSRDWGSDLDISGEFGERPSDP